MRLNYWRYQNKHALNINSPISKPCLVFFWWVLSAVWGRRWGGVQQWELQSFCSVQEQMGETRQGRMNSGQKEGDSRAWPPTCPPHTFPLCLLLTPSFLFQRSLSPFLICLSIFLSVFFYKHSFCLPLISPSPPLFRSSSFSFLCLAVYGGFSHQIRHIHPGVQSLYTRSHVMGIVWETFQTFLLSSSMLTTEILISNRGIANIYIYVCVCEGYLAQGYFQYLHRPLCKCAVHQNVFFHMKLSELFIFCSFLMKLAGFQTPESEICEAIFFCVCFFFSLILLMSLF